MRAGALGGGLDENKSGRAFGYSKNDYIKWSFLIK